MAKSKRIKEKGKIRLSDYFKELKEGDRVAVIRELSLKTSFPKRLQGRTGTIESKRGSAYIVKVKEYNKEKKFIIQPIHLKKLKAWYNTGKIT